MNMIYNVNIDHLFMCKCDFFFKQLPSKFIDDLVLLWFDNGASPLNDAAEGLILSTDKPFNFYTETL